MNEPGQWLNQISRATWTLLVAAFAVYAAWQLFRRLLPALLVIGGLLMIYRAVLADHRHGGL